jgi:hypothetical protein
VAAQRIRARREPAVLVALRRRSAAFYAVATLVTALLAAVVYTLVQARSPTTLQDEILHEHIGTPPGAVTVTWQLDKAPLAEAECEFDAIGAGQAVTGVATQVVGPNNRNLRTTTHTVVVRAAAGTTPVGATIASCRITRDH